MTLTIYIKVKVIGAASIINIYQHFLTIDNKVSSTYNYRRPPSWRLEVGGANGHFF